MILSLKYTHTHPLSTEHVSRVGNSCASVGPVYTALNDVIYL